MDLMKVRRRMLMEQKKRLPSAYQEVEWVRSTGTQFIDLPYAFDNTDEITITGAIETYGTDKFMLAPIRWNDNRNRFAMVGQIVMVNSNYLTVGYGATATGGTRLQPPVVNDFAMHTWTYKNELFSIPELGVTTDCTGIAFNAPTKQLRLFYGYNTTSTGKLSYYKHVKLNGEVYELIPCYRKSDGEIGMYDIANNVFYTNDGTGVFTKGADV